MALPKIVKKEHKTCNVSARVSPTDYNKLEAIKATYGLSVYDVLKIGIEYIEVKASKD